MSKEGFVGFMRHVCWFIVGCCIGLIGLPTDIQKGIHTFGQAYAKKRTSYSTSRGWGLRSPAFVLVG